MRTFALLVLVRFPREFSIHSLPGTYSLCTLSPGTAGIIPATEFLKGTSVNVEPDGSVLVDEFLHAGNSVFAAGDVAKFPYAYAAPGSLLRFAYLIRCCDWNLCLFAFCQALPWSALSTGT